MTQRNKNTNKLNQKNVDFVMKQIELPKGSILYQFKEYMKNHKKISDIITFISLKNAELLSKITSIDNINKSLKNELYEFYDFFMDNYDEITEIARFENWGQEPFIFRLTEYLLEQDNIEFEKQFLATRDNNVFREATSLCDTLFSIRKNRLFNFFIEDNFSQIHLPKTIKNFELDDARRMLLVHCCIVIEERGIIIAHIEEKNNNKQVFGIRILPIGIWTPMSKDDVIKLHTITPTGIEVESEEGVEYIEIMREKFLK